MKNTYSIISALILGLFLSSCGSGDEIKDFKLANSVDSLSYSTAINVCQNFKENSMPAMNAKEVRRGAEDFQADELDFPLKTADSLYQSIGYQSSQGQLNLDDLSDKERTAKIDSLSYALGALMGDYRQKQFNADINPIAFQAAVQDFADSSYRIPFQECVDINVAEVQQIQRQMQAERQQEMQARMKEMELAAEAYLPNKEAGEAFLADNLQKPGVASTPSGLQYKVVTQGNGVAPGPTSKVRVHYTGKTIDGKVFDSSVERGEPAEFGLDQVIRGWTEGLMLMQEGSKYLLYVPQELAYGIPGRLPAIEPYSTLIFEVELLKIVE